MTDEAKNEGMAVEEPTESKGNGENATPEEDVDNVPMRVKGEMFLRAKLAIAEWVEVQTRMKLIGYQIADEWKKPVHAPLLLLQQAETEIRKELSLKQANWATLQRKIAHDFGIPEEDIFKYTFDNESGILTPPPPPPKVEAEAATNPPEEGEH
jgi:hypothetical protein